jgi:CRISPR/Cas system Type II protein with McrA/HNH and RuvC-like nuclease domain
MKTQDYTEYFIPAKDGVLINTDIIKHRKEIGSKIWNMLKLLSGAGSEKDISEFEHLVDNLYLTRKEFDSILNVFFELVAKRDGKFCKICQTIEDLTVDHIVPLARGGDNTIENMQILCRKHNSKKGAR